MNRTIAVGITASALLVGPAAAQAAETGHHKNRAEKRQERIHDRREARREAKTSVDAGGAHGTQTTPAPTTAATVSPPSSSYRGSARRGVGAGVTADRTASGFVIHNTTDGPVTLTVSVQSQPSIWHDGLCKTGGCRLVSRYPVTVPPGTTTIALSTAGGCGYFQGDLKWDGRLIKAVHWFVKCTVPTPKPKPHPPVIQNPKPAAHIDGHKKPDTTPLAYTASQYDLAAYTALGGLFIVGGCAVLLTVGRKKEEQA